MKLIIRCVARVAVLCVAFIVVPTALAWTPQEMVAGKTIGRVDVSPDGGTVVWVQTRAVMTDELSVYQGIIYRADANGKNRRRMTFGRYSANAPAWSPDGEWIGFVHTGEDGKAQLAIMRPDGGEPRILTSVKTAVSGFKWSPDSESIAYLSVDAPSQEEEQRNKAKDDHIRVDEDFKYQHIHLVDVPADDAEQPESRQLTSGSFQVSHGYAPGFDWSPDGSRIAFGHTTEPGLNDWETSDLSVVDVASGEVSELRATPASEASPVYSPDGSRIAFVSSRVPTSWMRETYVGVVDADGANFREVAVTPNEIGNIVGWRNDRELLLFDVEGTTTALYAVDVSSGKLRRLENAPQVKSGVALNATGTAIGFAMMDSNEPQEAYVSSARRFTPVQVSAANQTDKPVGRTELVEWQSSDGMRIEGLLTYPNDWQEGVRVPLLLVVHGGPAGVFLRNYIAHPRYIYPVAAFAADGYAVLRPNPRGSGGRGADFRRANRNDWGGGDYRDLMAGVDHVIDMGVADPDRLGVMGWSYGGFMTSWIVGHTDRFKVASIGAPVTDLRAFNGTADIVDFLPDYFEGEFWEREEVYREHSPLSHVANVVTPSLIQHGQADARVPVGQGTAFYRALKRRGVEAKMVIYPRAPHGPAEPRQLLDVMQGNVDWVAKHLPMGGE